MHHLIGKKYKLLFYIFIFFILSTVNNITFSYNNDIGKIKKLRIYGLDENFRSILENQISFLIGQNIFFINENEIKKEINKLNFINQFSIKKHFPSTMVIKVEMTNLFAKIIVNNKSYFIAENGKLIESEFFKNSKDLPNYFGRYSKKSFFYLKKQLDNSNFDYGQIESIYYFPSDRWDIKRKDGILLKLPKNNIKRAIKLAEKIISKFNKKNNYLIDLRIPNSVIISDE